MKALLLCSSVLSLIATAALADIPAPVDVSVIDSSGKAVFKGKTNALGAFSTRSVTPGTYIIQFNSKDPKIAAGSFAALVQAGSSRVNANGIPGKQFASGGVAMKLDVKNPKEISGIVANADVSGGKGNAKVKIVGNHRYVWISGGGVGSNLGGRWVEDGLLDGLNAHRISDESVRAIQDAGTPTIQDKGVSSPFRGGGVSGSGN